MVQYKRKTKPITVQHKRKTKQAWYNTNVKQNKRASFVLHLCCTVMVFVLHLCCTVLLLFYACVVPSLFPIFFVLTTLLIVILQDFYYDVLLSKHGTTQA
jgi:uncharacterized membrane protein